MDSSSIKKTPYISNQQKPEEEKTSSDSAKQDKIGFINKLAFGDQLSQLKMKKNYILRKLNADDPKAELNKEQLEQECKNLEQEIGKLCVELIPLIDFLKFQRDQKKAAIDKAKSDIELLEDDKNTDFNISEEVKALIREQQTDNHQELISFLKNKLNLLQEEHEKLDNEIRKKADSLQEQYKTIRAALDPKQERLLHLGQLERLEKRRDSLQEHIKSLTLEQKIGVIWKKATGSLNPIRNLVMHIIHPARTVYSEENIYPSTEKKEQARTEEQKQRKKILTNYHKVIDKSVRSGKTDQVTFYNEDNQQLDGYVIKASNPSRPVILFTIGNLMAAEEIFTLAESYSRKFDINVVIYNSRGILGSLGKEHSTLESVKDCEAAIRFTTRHFKGSDEEFDYKKLAVHGQSLGGGISATALKRMVKKKEIPAKGIGLYINCHSFSSLQGFVVGIFSEKTRPKIERIFQGILKFIRLNTLDAEKALRKGIAHSVVVTTANQDEVIPSSGRLSSRIQDLNSVKFVTGEYGHNDTYTEKYLVAETGYEEAIRAWSTKSESL